MIYQHFAWFNEEAWILTSLTSPLPSGPISHVLAPVFLCKIVQIDPSRFGCSLIFIGRSHFSCFIYLENLLGSRLFFYSSCLWMWSSWNFARTRHLYQSSSFSSSSFFSTHFIFWLKLRLPLCQTLVNPKNLTKMYSKRLICWYLTEYYHEHSIFLSPPIFHFELLNSMRGSHLIHHFFLWCLPLPQCQAHLLPHYLLISSLTQDFWFE